MREAVAALRHVDIAAPEQRIAQYPHQMSGGMKQRVVGAIAMSGHPEVLIADEPTTALDVTIQLQYLKLLKRLQQESGMAILFITHDFGVVARMCDRVAVMYAGRIVECGPVRQVFEHPSHPYTQALIASVPQLSGTIGRLDHDRGPAAVAAGPAGRAAASRRAAPMRAALPGRLSRQLRCRRRAHRRLLAACARMTGEPLLRVEHLRKHFPFTKGMLLAVTLGEVKAVDDISFTIAAGETLGLVGESGCGKTTTSKLILNLEQPTSGQVLLEGKPIHGLQRRGAARLPRIGAGGVPGSVVLAQSAHDGRPDHCRIADRRPAGATARRSQSGSANFCAQVGLRPEQATQYPHEFSGGQRQRIALAGALASRPRLIVLDEPVSALDVSIRAQMMNLLKDIQAQDNVAYLLVAHDLATVRYMADDTVVMYLGKIVEYAPTRSLFDDVRHPYTKALLSAVLPPRAGSRRGRGDRADRRDPLAARSAARLPVPHALSFRHAALYAGGAGPARSHAGPSGCLPSGGLT